MNDLIINLKDIHKKFGKTEVLKGVNLEVNRGEVMGFLGPNGAGKSTTIRIILGMIKANSGTAEIFGFDAWKDAKLIHERISYIPGDVNLWANLTGGEVIDMLLSFDRSARRGANKKLQTQRKNELVEMFQLDPSKKIRTLSKGNRQKVALISALTQDADLFVFDEPTSGLDPLMENIFQNCVAEKRDEGKAILLSSHILSEVEQLANRVAIIRDGEVIGVGSLEELNGQISLEDLFINVYNQNQTNASSF